MADFEPWSTESAQVHLVSLPEDERLILPNLQYLQGIFGYIHPEAVPLIASELNVSVADVHGVLTFYHELKSSPPAPVTLAICVAEACQASGSRALVSHLEGSIAPMGARSEDGQIEIALQPNAPKTFVHDLQRKLTAWTGKRWIVVVSKEQGAMTVRAQADARQAEVERDVQSDPLVQEVLNKFPGAKIVAVTQNAPEAAVPDAAPPEEDED